MRVTGAPAMERGGRGEQQFVVLAAMEGLVQGCARMERQGGRVHFGGNPRLLAKVGEVGGETVAQVEGGGGQAAALEPETLGNAGLRVEVGCKNSFKLLRDVRKRREARLGLGRFQPASQFRETGEAGGGSA